MEPRCLRAPPPLPAKPSHNSDTLKYLSLWWGATQSITNEIISLWYSEVLYVQEGGRGVQDEIREAKSVSQLRRKWQWGGGGAEGGESAEWMVGN